MNELQIFNNKEFGEIRTIIIENDPWLVGKDICHVFGDKNHNRSIGRVACEDKREEEIVDSLGRKQKAICVNESGLYTLLFSMQPQKAHNNGMSDEYPIEVQERIEKLKRFKHWVTSEVLPSIRKNGGYIAGQEKMSDAELMAKALQVAQRTLENRNKEIETLKTTNAVQQQQIAEMNPKATYYDLVLQCPDLLSATEIAKDYGKNAKWLNKILSDNKIQFKQCGIWFLYSKYAEQGYTSTKTQSFVDKDSIVHTKTHTYWTQKGRLFIYDFLKKLGYFPVIEQQQKGA